MSAGGERRWKRRLLFFIFIRNIVDLEVPLDLTAKELAAALNEAYGLGVDLSDINNCYLKAQNPIMLLKGNRTLKEFGVRNGTIISMAE